MIGDFPFLREKLYGMDTDMTFCSNELCSHRQHCARGSKAPDVVYAVSEFKLDSKGKCSMFMMKSAEQIGHYYDAIPVPLVLDIEVITEPDQLPTTVCYGCRLPTDNYAQCSTKENYINVCDVCLSKLDQVSFRSRSVESGSLSDS